MFNKKFKIIVLFLFMILVASPVAAANLSNAFNLDNNNNNDPLDNVADRAGFNTNQTGVNPIIETVIQVALSFLGVIFLILTIYGGILWMTAGGNEEQIKKAQSLLKSAIIGLIIVIAAYAISWYVISALSKKTLQESSGESGGSKSGAIIKLYS